MRCYGINADSSGIGRRLPKEIAGFLTSQDWLFGGATGDKPRIHQRRLRIEPLENRHLMAAAAAASLVSPLWFQNIAGADATVHAGVANWMIESTASSGGQNVAAATGLQNVYDWIVQFDTASLGGIGSVAATASLLAGGGANFQVLEGLGLTGLVLARSSGASFGAVESWLGSNVNVASFELDAVDQVGSTPNDSQYGQLWGMTAIDAPAAWNVSTGSSSVVVAVIDTGVDYKHRDLAANIWTNPGEIAGNGIDDDNNGFVDDVHGYDFVNNDGDPMDDNSHGTHVSGTIAAVGNNSQGVAGVNWSSSIMALKFLNADGTGYLSDAIRAVNYATMMRTQFGVNVRVINNSWGGGEYSSALDSAIRASDNADILFVAAAGNNGSNNDSSPQYPANYTADNVISVAAVDQNKNLASFSCYGAATVDIAAPGVSIYSTVPGNRYAIYSGTSMATPFVSGVAALAWAVDPTATVAEIRSAILAGVDHVSSLSGKVAAGGVLNAYKTLTSLHSETPQGPVVGSLVASPGSVAVGAAVTLSAHGVGDPDGSVTSVSFILDSNDNGQCDATDAVLGSTTSVVNGQASITVGAGGWSSGTHRIFARAQDDSLIWSSAVSTTLTVLSADDHGNSAAAASAVAVPSSTAGTIETSGDVDWFKFQAAAGKAYVFSVTLGTLSDSVLYLYDANGVKQLAFNDDCGSSAASQIAWTAPADGVYYLAVAGYGGGNTGAYTLSVQRPSSAPVLSHIGDQTLPYSQTTLVVPLNASDADGDSLTYSVQAMTVDTLAQKAYTLDQSLGLHTYANGSYYQNSRGANEKYILDKNGALYFILPNGSLYRWSSSLAKSPLVATLSPAYHANPSLLWSATMPTLTSLGNSSVAVTMSGNTLTVTRAAGYTGSLYVKVSVSDGSASAAEVFTVTDPLAQQAYSLDQSLGLHTYANGSYYQNSRGANEKYLLDKNDALYFILPNGSLYRWSGGLAKSPLVATLSPAYHANPSLLHDAQSPAVTAAVASAGCSSVKSAAAADSIDVGVKTAAVEATAGFANVAVAWLAGEENSSLVFTYDGIAPVVAATPDAATASLHDRVLGGLSAADSRGSREAPLTMLDYRFGRLLTGGRPHSEPHADERELADFVFDLPVETLLPPADWLS